MWVDKLCLPIVLKVLQGSKVTKVAKVDRARLHGWASQEPEEPEEPEPLWVAQVTKLVKPCTSNQLCLQCLQPGLYHPCPQHLLLPATL